MKIGKVILIVLSLSIIFGLIGCSSIAKNTGNSTDKIDVRGSITKITFDKVKGITNILVEGRVEKDTSVDKASVTLDQKTKIYRNNSTEDLSQDALKEGMKVEVVFEGPVRESYPVQADAKIVRIIE